MLFGWLALRQRELQTWVPVEGEVVRVWTKTRMEPPQETIHGTLPPKELIDPWIVYSYRVDGRKYSGEALAGLSQGRGLTVYYDSDHPEESRLGRPEGSPLIFVTGALIQLLGGIVLALGGRRGAKIRELQ